MRIRVQIFHLLVGLMYLLLIDTACAAQAYGATPTTVLEGKNLAIISGCNDCHTSGYAGSGGQVPMKNWLEGDTLGWNGPWGTTYAPNLRLFMAHTTLKQWLHFARTAKLRPPMPYWGLRHMSKRQLTALFEFIRHLGPAGKSAPGYLPPGVKPKAPYVTWVLPKRAP